MRFTVRLDEFAAAAAFVGRTIPARPLQPILGGVKIDVEADAGRVRLAGFDYEVSAEAFTDTVTAEDGSVVLSGRLLGDFLGACRGPGDVSLVIEGAMAEVSHGKAVLKTPIMPVEDYPTLPVMGPGERIGSLECSAWTSAVAQTAFAVGSLDNNAIAGVHIETTEDDELVLVATDRYRLAARTAPWQPEVPGQEMSLQVLPAPLQEIAKVSGERAEVYLKRDTAGSPSMLGVAIGSRRITTRLLSSEFPKWRGFFDKVRRAQEVSVITLEAANVVDTLKRVKLVTEGVARSVVVDASPEGIALTAGNESAVNDVLDGALEGPSVTVRTNVAFLQQAVTACGADTVRWLLPHDAGMLSLVVPSDGETSDFAHPYQHVLMLMTV